MADSSLALSAPSTYVNGTSLSGTTLTTDLTAIVNGVNAIVETSSGHSHDGTDSRALGAQTFTGKTTLNQDGNYPALRIDVEATTATAALEILADTLTTGHVIDISDADELTTGSILYLASDSSATDVRNLVHITNSNSTAANAVGLKISQVGNANAVHIDQDGEGHALLIQPDGLSTSAIYISAPKETIGNIITVPDADALTTGSILDLVSGSVSTGTRSLVYVENETSTATGATLVELKQDAAQRGLFLDQNGADNAIEIDADCSTSGSIAAIKIVADNAGSGTASGLDLSSFTPGEFLAQVANNPRSAAFETPTGMFAVKVGVGTTGYVPIYHLT